MCANTTKVGDRNKICWEGDEPLVWKDFKGSVPSRTDQVAYTTVHFSYKVPAKNSIQVLNCFVKDKSWVKKDKRLPRILAHEQYHFHISEIFARRMRRDMAKITIPTIPNVEGPFDEWLEKYYVEQALYDKETSHSQIRTEQIKWEEKIDKELKELEAYKDQIVYLNQ